ncbi:MAG: DUF4440 domain-containing protein [Lewinellaceae bacterium]|nr:DUF4440 domain-containing protein [Lewinellaceae bacterium]
MKKQLLFPILFLPLLASGQELSIDSLYALAVDDLPAFSQYIAAEAETDCEKARAVVDWYARHFDWTHTDYQQRTVQDILQRRGGNCNELAMVAKASLETLGLKMRRVREINLHITSDRRQADAEQRVTEIGDKASVFGRQHNDHVWLEIYDQATGRWLPADPSLGVVGLRPWLSARYSFGRRYSLDSSSEDMIAPFAVFAESGGEWIDRTADYAIEGFNSLYYGQLAKLPSWQRWAEQAEQLDDLALAAFQSKANLHEHSAKIAALVETYEQLKREFLETDLGAIHQNIDAFSQSLVEQDFEAVVAAYTPDAKLFPQRGDIRRGEAAVRRYWTPSGSQKSRTVHHRIKPEEIVVQGDMAYDWGYYEGATLRGDGTEVYWEGKYVIVWKKTADGQWKIYLDSWNNL